MHSPRIMLTDPFGVNQLTRAIIGCAIRVHQVIGPGVYESVYGECLAYELKEARLSFELGRAAPLVYRGTTLKSRYYADLIVDQRVVVELKCVASLAEIHKRQVITLLRLTGLPIGLLINFNVVVLTNGGIKRIVNPAFTTASQT